MTNKYDRRNMPFGNAFAVADPAVVRHLKSMNVSMIDVLEDEDIHSKFLEKYQQWILTTQNNTVIGLEQYSYACFSNGTTEAFDKFHAKHSTKRFRFFKGEYLYHRLSCRNNNYDWSYLEEGPVQDNDVVIVSLPFSDTGSMHISMDVILDQCDALGVPVLLDCAYFGVCSGIKFDLTRKCITDVTFSLSKSLYAAHLRIGMRLTRIDDDDQLFVTNKIGYVNKVSAAIGTELIKNFSPDYIYNTYKDRQKLYCDILNVDASSCVLFGIGGLPWNEYNRDRETNRLSFHKFLPNDCTEEIKWIANEKS